MHIPPGTPGRSGVHPGRLGQVPVAWSAGGAGRGCGGVGRGAVEGDSGRQQPGAGPLGSRGPKPPPTATSWVLGPTPAHTRSSGLQARRQRSEPPAPAPARRGLPLQLRLPRPRSVAPRRPHPHPEQRGQESPLRSPGRPPAPPGSQPALHLAAPAHPARKSCSFWGSATPLASPQCPPGRRVPKLPRPRGTSMGPPRTLLSWGGGGFRDQEQKLGRFWDISMKDTVYARGWHSVCRMSSLPSAALG